MALNEKNKYIFLKKLLNELSSKLEVCLCTLWRTGRIDKKIWEEMLGGWRKKIHNFDISFKPSIEIDAINEKLISDHFDASELMTENTELRSMGNILDLAKRAEKRLEGNDFPD